MQKSQPIFGPQNRPLPYQNLHCSLLIKFPTQKFGKKPKILHVKVP